MHRKILSDGAVHHVAVTNMFFVRLARGIVNRVMQGSGPLSELPPVFPLSSIVIGPLCAASKSFGKGDFTLHWTGQIVSGCQEIPAAKLTQLLASEL